MEVHFFVSLLSLILLSLPPFFTSANKDTQNLINFKTTLSNPSLLQNWLPNQNPCIFTGVKCQDTTNRVSSIDLTNISLTCDFHPVAAFLLTLENLESLSLKSANVSGTISFPFGSKCSSVLSNLDLSQNSLSGSVSDIAALRSCPALKSLNLSGNSIEFSVPKEKSSGLGGLSFTFIDLSFNKIVGSNVVPFILSGGCNDLKYLGLKGNKVSGDVDFSSCKNLQYLDVSSNNFSVTVPSFGDCLALEHLDISSNKFYGDLGRAIGGCAKLNFLNVSSNKFSGPIPVFPTGNLQSLSLGGNHFEGEIPLHLMDACPGLVMLDLSSNNLSGSVPSSFGSCTSLESFDISTNNFTGELSLDTFLKMTSLKRLDLAYNAFMGGLPDSFSQHASLESLDLSSNSLSGPIPAGLCQGPSNNFKELYLQNNRFTGSIPATLSNCSQLTALHLSYNYLTGTIPSSLGTLNKLRDLNLWFNQLHGEIPLELMNIKALETLILDFNELTGVIPSSISNCTNLNWISLSNNRLSGEIPASIGQLWSLAILKLSNNSFHGRIPPELGDSRSLIWLDLNTNFLNGTIPPELFKQSGSIAVNFIRGKRYVYLKNEKSEQCHGEGDLLEFAGIRSEQLARISSRHPCNFTRVYGDYTQPTFNDNGSMNFLDLSYNMLSGSLCGIPLPPCGSGAASSSSSGHHKSHRRQASLAESVAMGLLFSLFCFFGLIIVALEMKKRKKKKDAALDIYIDSRSHSGTTNTAWKLTAREALSISLATFDSKHLRKLTYADLLEATNGFHNESLIGSGGFGDVYKAELKDGSVVAIKKLIHISGQGDREFTAEMETIGKIKHDNLVPLLGYCKVREERLLVYEYMKYGKRPTDSSDFGDNNLVGWVKQHAKLRISDVFDPVLLKEDPSLEMELLEHLKIACACLDDRSGKRPTMIQVMTMFKEIQAGSGLHSQSTIATEDGGFGADEMVVELSIREGP
ncbi:systemin receptor SR160-like [Populus alba x Populus x berolinensis]|uniref:non-specific serine/threonine protein kinase n=1 Tax=Populus alba x Populus x berolinensis TaxID=444605 RepID=A0AAD6QV72_9ROSI|nr:systemin receptor SR160-like [Populus alba x Populus x berolinensis]